MVRSNLLFKLVIALIIDGLVFGLIFAIPQFGTTIPQWAKVNLWKKATEKQSWAIKDLVEVPESLEPGQYILSFRWDCLNTPQVWASCANIEIV